MRIIALSNPIFDPGGCGFTNIQVTCTKRAKLRTNIRGSQKLFLREWLYLFLFGNLLWMVRHNCIKCTITMQRDNFVLPADGGE